jgi:hypothetical protein
VHGCVIRATAMSTNLLDRLDARLAALGANEALLPIVPFRPALLDVRLEARDATWLASETGRRALGRSRHRVPHSACASPTRSLNSSVARSSVVSLTRSRHARSRAGVAGSSTSAIPIRRRHCTSATCAISRSATRLRARRLRWALMWSARAAWATSAAAWGRRWPAISSTVKTGRRPSTASRAIA